MSSVRLRNSYLLIDADVARRVIGDTQHVYLCYYPERMSLLVASTTEEWFEKMHKVTQSFCKDRTTLGDKSISVREILLEFELDETNRDLTFDIQAHGRLLNIRLH